MSHFVASKKMSEAIYLDTCALAKAYLEETESEAVRMVIYSGEHLVFTSVVAFGELQGVLQKHRDKEDPNHILSLLFGIRMALSDFSPGPIQVVEPTTNRVGFFLRSGELVREVPQVGAFDIWHLMAFENLQEQQHPEAKFLTFDGPLKEAAAKLSIPLATLPPASS